MANRFNVHALAPFRIESKSGERFEVGAGRVTIELNSSMLVPRKVGNYLIKVATKNDATITCEGGQNEGDQKYKIDWQYVRGLKVAKSGKWKSGKLLTSLANCEGIKFENCVKSDFNGCQNSKVQLPGTHQLIANQRGGRAPGGVGSLSKAETINKPDPPIRRKTQQKSASFFTQQYSMNSSRKPAESVAQKATAWSNATSGQSSYGGGGGTLQSLGRGISKVGSSFGLTQSPTIPGGIRNLGNTCYIGATLQALLAQAPFVNDLLSPAWQGINQTVQHHLACSNKQSEDGVSSRLEKALRSPQRSLVVQLRQLAERSQDLARRKSGPQGMLNSIDVTAFKSALDQYTPFFHGFRQNDAQEFFSSLINGIFEESEGQLKWYLHREGASLLTPVEATVGTDTIETVESANTSFESGRSDEDVNTNVPEIVDLGEDSNDGHAIGVDSTTPKKVETGIADWHLGPDGGEKEERVSTKTESVVSADPASSASTTPAGSTGANTPSTGKRSIAGDAAPQSTATPSDGMLMPDLMYTMIPTVRHFKAGIQFQTFCSKCGHHQSERLEGYSEIPLDLLMDQDRTSKPASGNFFGAIAPKLPTLRVRDLLKHFFKDDRRSFTCEHCDDKSDGNAIYKSRLVKMPQVLVLHLKRFTYDLKNGTLEKNRRALQVPPILEVAEWDDAARDEGESASSSSGAKSVESARVCSAMATTYDARIDLQKGPKGAIDAASAAIAMAASNHDAEIEGSTSSSSSLPGRYALSGVVRHLGIDCKSGHYVADVPMPQKAGTASTGISLSDKWKRCDDSTVREIPLEKVIADKESPYLLFYRLVGTGSVDIVSREA